MLADLFAAINSTAAALTAYNAANDAGVVTALNAKTIVMQDHTLRNAKWITATFNKSNSALILNSFKNAADATIQADYYALVSNGIDLADSDTRDNIDALAASVPWTNALRNNLKERGRWSIGAAMQRIGRDATLQDIADVCVWQASVFNVDALSRRASSAHSTVQSEIQSGVLATIEQVRTRMGELLA